MAGMAPNPCLLDIYTDWTLNSTELSIFSISTQHVLMIKCTSLRDSPHRKYRSWKLIKHLGVILFSPILPSPQPSLSCSGSGPSSFQHLLVVLKATWPQTLLFINCDFCQDFEQKDGVWWSMGCFKHLLYLSSVRCCQGTWWRVLSCLSQAWLALSQWRAGKFWVETKGVNGKSLSVELEIFENIHRICYNDIHTLYYHTHKHTHTHTHTHPLKMVGQLTSHYQPPFWDPHPCTLGGQLGELGWPIKARSQWRQWNLLEGTYIVCMMVYQCIIFVAFYLYNRQFQCSWISSMSRTTFSRSLATWAMFHDVYHDSFVHP